MFIKVVCFALLINVVVTDKVKNELKPNNFTTGPFFELPCLVVGGICAKDGNCPKEYTMVTKGMCPVQQQEGVECCRRRTKRSIGKSITLPNEFSVDCRSRGGDCVSTEVVTCPYFLTVREATDCAKNENCCIFIN